MGRRNFGVSIDDSRWDAFVKKAIELQSFELRVGILRAGTKYPAGWVGTKSRLQDNMGRFADLKQGAERRRQMLAAHAGKDQKVVSYKRRAKRKRVDVGKVAAVVGYQKGKRPKIPSMWFRTTERLDSFVHSRAKVAIEMAINGATSRKAIEQIGTRLMMAYKADVLRSGHRDTGLLLKTIKWELVDTAGQTAHRELLKARREERRLAKKAAK